MRKGWMILIVAALMLAACSQATKPVNDGKGVSTGLPTEDPSAKKMECKVVGSVISTPDPATLTKFPASMPGDWTRGKDGATLNVLEYSDYM